MAHEAVRYVVGLAAGALFAGAVFASQVVPGTPTGPGIALASCQLPEVDGESNAVTDREAAMQRYEALPQQCLKAIVVVCSQAANTGLLDLGHAAACSVGYEALLKRGFSGDFQALMSWWQRQRASTGLAN